MSYSSLVSNELLSKSVEHSDSYFSIFKIFFSAVSKLLVSSKESYFSLFILYISLLETDLNY